MGNFIYFTEEQLARANEVDLEDLLRRRGEKLLPSGRDKRLSSDKSITIRGNAWFDHSAQAGGKAIDLMQKHYGMSFPEAVLVLLNGEQGQPYALAGQREPRPKKPFQMPEANRDMRRVYAYLMKQRHIDKEVIGYFARAGTLYEDARYHNCVFAGKDKKGGFPPRPQAQHQQ